MRILFTIIFAIFSVNIFGYPFRVVQDTLLLSELTFSIAKKEIANLVTYFHDPDCLPCKQFQQKFHDIAAQFKKDIKNEYTLSLSYVDISLENQLPKDLELLYFPAVIYFKDGKELSRYSGALEPKDIKQWIQSNIDIPIKTLDGTTESDIFKSHDLALVVYGKYDPADVPNFLHEVQRFRSQVDVFNIDDIKFKEQYGLSDGNLILLSRYDSKFREFATSMKSLKDLKRALIAQIVTLPQVLDEKIAKEIETIPLMYYVYFTRSDMDDYEERQEFAKAFNQLKLNKVKIIKADIQSPLGATLAQALGIKKKDVPTAGIIDTRGNLIQKYKFSEEFNQANLIAFCEKVMAGMIDKFHLSEIVDPEERQYTKYGKYITPIAGEEFEDIALNDKDTLVVFCTPSVLACQMFENTYKSLAYQLRKSDIIVGKVDTSKNDLNEPIDEYPVVQFFKNGNKEGVRYKGNFNIIYIKRWLKGLSVKFDD